MSRAARRADVEGPLHAEIVARLAHGPNSDPMFRLVSSVRDYAIFLLDPKGRIASWNPGAERAKGYRADEIIGQHFSVFYPPEDVQAGKCELELQIAAAEGRYEEEGWRARKDGSRFWANVVISAVRDESGALVGYAKVTRDLTDRKAREEERAARLAAEAANRAKDEFVAMLAHELRNPLAPILTALEVMSLREHGDHARERVVIHRQVRHLMRLVDDLLDVSRVTRGALVLDRKRVDLRDVVRDAIEMASTLIEQRRHRLDVKIPEAAVPVDGDEARLRQVVANLLINAAKYTPPGGNVAVLLGASGTTAHVEVRDDGDGIAPDLLPRVFDLFVQGEGARIGASGGLGLGLTLVRSLVTKHGGVVEARSEGPGLGSVFVVRLPLAEGAEAPRPEVEPEAVSRTRRRVLVVDDNDDGREMMEMWLQTLGHEVKTACDGPSALAAVESFSPDVAMLDIGLPVMDGYELAARLRTALTGRPPRLVALTGYGTEADRARAHAAGFDRHLVKPIDEAMLADALGEPEPSGSA